MRFLPTLAAFFCLIASSAWSDRATFLDLARRGWNYELRTTMLGRDLTIPVHINGRDLVGATICLVGEKPHPHSLAVISAFRDLVHDVFGKPFPSRFVGPEARACGKGHIVILRLYSGHPTNHALSRDLNWLNATYQLGLPPDRFYPATSPAMAQTFFGRRGQGTHIMVKQPALARPGKLERAFYRSILIEELFQAFTFGIDIAHFDRTAGFTSKLQERPIRIGRMPWESRRFMRALAGSNPSGLCLFDLFMLNAIAKSPADQTISTSFVEFIEFRFDHLLELAISAMDDPRFEPVVDPDCKPYS